MPRGAQTVTLKRLPVAFAPGSETVEKSTELRGGKTAAVGWNVQAVPAPAAVVKGERWSFSPASVTIRAGEAVRFEYAAGSPHTVTPENPSGFWVERRLANAADNFTLTFNTPGTYRYLCVPHATGFAPGQGMNGVIIVQ
ncbi:MAG TPA: plastocyanin/azurin family copper-binding protein [Longimicrobiaceae bacterium]|nr:plastocyanin/azurin family copper-binding protein [Longimicrobiaceae bacterium]